MTRHRAPLLLLVVTAFVACGGDSGVRTGSAELRTEAEREIYEQMRSLGATEEEAVCIAVGLADGAETIEEAEERNPTAHFDSLSEVLEEFVPECGSPERFAELEATERSMRAELQRDIERMGVETRAGFYREGGASDSEAVCMAEVAVEADPQEVPPVRDIYYVGDPRLELFATCASLERIVKIHATAFWSSVHSELVEAGATGTQATCLIEHLQDIQRLFLYGSFDGTRSESSTIERFVREGAACANERVLTSIARELHRQFDS